MDVAIYKKFANKKKEKEILKKKKQEKTRKRVGEPWNQHPRTIQNGGYKHNLNLFSWISSGS